VADLQYERLGAKPQGNPRVLGVVGCARQAQDKTTLRDVIEAVQACDELSEQDRAFVLRILTTAEAR